MLQKRETEELYGGENLKHDKPVKRKRKRRGKAAADPERISGDGSAPRRAFRRATWGGGELLFLFCAKELGG